MKTISGKPISTKPISLSKAAKILSKFISAENGASQAISAYLHRASSSFSELNQLHKELKSPRSEKKHKSRSKTRDDRGKIEENSIWSAEINQGAVHQFGSENNGKDEEKSSQTIVKFNQEPNETTEYHAGNEGESERHKKKKKKHNVKFQERGANGVETGEREGEFKSLTEAGNENEEKPAHIVLDLSQEPNEREKDKKKKKCEDESKKHVANEVKFEEVSNEGNAGDDKGVEEGKKHKREKKKKDKDGMNNFSGSKGEVIKPVADEVKFEEGSNEGNTGDDNKGVEEGKKHKREKKKKKDKDGMNNFSGNEGEVIKPVADEVKFEEGSNEGNAGDDNKGVEEGKKHKKEKKKKDKDGTNNFSGNDGEVIKAEDESAKRTDDQKVILSNGLGYKNVGLVDQQELQSKKKKRNKTVSEDKVNTDEVNRVQKKRKNIDVEGRDEDRSAEPSKKLKRKHGEDD